MNKELNKTNDYELIMLYHENDEEAKNILFMKYKFIIDILIKKYSGISSSLNIDSQEIYSECTVGFSDALRSYQDNRDTSLPTFITLCIERKITSLLKKYNREKYKVIQNTYSLDYSYEEFNRPLIEMLTDNKNEPLLNMTNEENYHELLDNIKNNLSKKEYEVFNLMLKGFDYQQIAKILQNTPKQIDNTMQRIKVKIEKLVSVYN